jgi:hypothetical protein
LRFSPEPSVIYRPSRSKSQKRLENPRRFWNN